MSFSFFLSFFSASCFVPLFVFVFVSSRFFSAVFFFLLSVGVLPVAYSLSPPSREIPPLRPLVCQRSLYYNNIRTYNSFTLSFFLFFLFSLERCHYCAAPITVQPQPSFLRSFIYSELGIAVRWMLFVRFLVHTRNSRLLSSLFVKYDLILFANAAVRKNAGPNFLLLRSSVGWTGKQTKHTLFFPLTKKTSNTQIP